MGGCTFKNTCEISDKMTKQINIKETITRLIAAIITILSLLLISIAGVHANQTSEPGTNGSIANPGINLWKEVRQRDGASLATTQMKQQDSATLIDSAGEYWRQLRVNEIIPYSGYLLLITIIVLAVFRLIRGQVKIKAGRSEKQLLRFTFSQRTVHWIVAVLFIILGLTGIIILLGRTILLPYIGSEFFAALASLSKISHDYCGPIFAIALIFMFISFVKGNMFKLKDINWFLNGGGMLGKHASAGRYNAGEKSWFWLAMFGGILIVASGLILDFPWFNFDRAGLSLTLIVHAIAAVIVLVAAIGHIYMGTVAMEGALESMTTGYCDENWAKEHHDEWYKEMHSDN